MLLWIQTIALIASALGAIFLIYDNGKSARSRATVDHIIHQATNRELLDAIAVVYKLRNDKAPLTDHLKDKDSDEFKAILKVLNHYEFIALGIRRKVFDENVYKDLQCSNIGKVWKAASGVVGEIRREEDPPTFFHEFEWLAQRWDKSPVVKH